MATMLAFVVGGLFASAFYLLLRRNVVKLIIGLGLLTNATNLLLFGIGGLPQAKPPILAEGDLPDPSSFAEPLPQALILTSIVIGFATQAFATILIYRVVRTLGTDDLDKVRSTDVQES